MAINRSQPEDATQLLLAVADGDKAAADRLLPLVYDQLRKAAQIGLAGERPGHTISATALVHEAYLKLVGPREVAWANRRHFYVAAAEAMRRILIDYAKARGRQKRGPGPGRFEDCSKLLSVADLVADARSDQIVMLEEAVRRLEIEDPTWLKSFGSGFTPGAAATRPRRHSASLRQQST